VAYTYESSDPTRAMAAALTKALGATAPHDQIEQVALVLVDAITAAVTEHTATKVAAVNATLEGFHRRIDAVIETATGGRPSLVSTPPRSHQGASTRALRHRYVP